MRVLKFGTICLANLKKVIYHYQDLKLCSETDNIYLHAKFIYASREIKLWEGYIYVFNSQRPLGNQLCKLFAEGLPLLLVNKIK